jgi:hypothetical protein
MYINLKIEAPGSFIHAEPHHSMESRYVALSITLVSGKQKYLLTKKVYHDV